MTLFKTIFTGIIMAKVTGIVFSIIGFCQITPPSHRKIAATTSLPKSAGNRKRSSAISENAMHKNATTYEIYIVLSSLLKTAIMIPSALENGIALVH